MEKLEVKVEMWINVCVDENETLESVLEKLGDCSDLSDIYETFGDIDIMDADILDCDLVNGERCVFVDGEMYSWLKDDINGGGEYKKCDYDINK